MGWGDRNWFPESLPLYLVNLTFNIMSDLIFFLKLHIAELVIFLLCLGGTILIYFNIRKKPESWGIKTPLTWRSYTPMVFPLIIFVVTLFFIHRGGGFSYPTGIAVHEDVVIIRGVSENETEDSNGISETTYTSQLILLNKKDGSEIVQLNVAPMYVQADKLFGDGGAFYQIIDLKTGKVLELLSTGDIESQVAVVSPEKVYAMEFKGIGFEVRTVKDKYFMYDPIRKNVTNEESVNPFIAMRHQDFMSDKHNLFQPKIIAQTASGTTLLMSYSDLEKEHFFIHAIDGAGNMLWSKQDSEISPDLEGELFVSNELKENTVTDNNNLYFANRSYVVCMSLQNGALQWIAGI